MTNLFIDIFNNSKEFGGLLNGIKQKQSPIVVNGLSGSAIAHISFALNNKLKNQMIIITHSELEAKKILYDLKFFDEENVYYFPPKEIVFYDVYAHSKEIIKERLKAIDSIVKGEKCIIVTTIEAVLEKLIPHEDWALYRQILKVGDIINVDDFIKSLLNMGYERVEIVEASGQFSLRGGIIDFYSSVDDNPYRIELFDNEIDSIRIFDVESQISQEKVQKIELKPAKEILIDDNRINCGIKNIKNDFKEFIKKLKGDSKKKLEERINEIISKLENNIYFEGIDSFINYFMEKTETLIDYIDDKALVLIHESSRVKERAENFQKDFRKRFEMFFEKGEVLPGQIDVIEDYDKLIKDNEKNIFIVINSLPKRINDFMPKQIISFPMQDMSSYHGKLNLLIEDLKGWKYRGYKVVILSGTQEKGKNLEREFRNDGIECACINNLDKTILSGQTFIMNGNLSSGFIYNTFKFAVVTENEIYGVSKRIKRKKKKYKEGRKIKSFRDLSVGDYVVHENHGIGKYIGIEQLKVEGVKKDYLKIQYSGGDYLYVPIDQMDLVQKYIGGEDRVPKINKLGGNEWKKTKAKVKSAIEDMAKDLLKLYAVRQSTKGHAFSPDTEWQREFENLFPYEETPDQLKCIEEIKRDMEKSIPMDRLLCGDVGYGKTEVAIRAAFKAVMDGKQVAFLVPTTILAQQHFNTLSQRLSSFPIKVEMLSRFRSKAQQNRIIEDLGLGMIDIIVGTHRLLSKDVKFKDLGLLIVDEEQRFGVKHKEALKHLRKNVDVLTLTATPIPRTLHMSLIGIRDMSVIEDPPEDRYPVETYVTQYNEGMVREAILRELERGGQVYFVYNRVRDIDKMAFRIKELVPEAKVEYAHGQMSERKLENIMLDFLNKEFDVLVCTTIIETGLDIGNVNTMIIYDADKMGLSQLYQLRGRVGRSNRIAYCYLTYQKDKILSETAEKRLKAIKEFTELGSGFKIAMKDLEIRGAGNLLGSQQHGHMASIGYDLYCKLLEDTIKTLKGEEVEEVIETNIDITVNAYISDEYINNEKQKLEIYKKIASIRSKEDAYDVEEEVEDRFGTLPESVYNLISIAYIKVLAQKLKINSISETKEGIKFEFDTRFKIDPFVIAKATEEFGRKIIFNCSSKPFFIYRHQNKGLQYRKLQEIKEVLEKIRGFHKN
ncbi:transcription-repair coupling factor [Caminicella sporogenes DSM 14501]|uniref:Transcription-repair-coupling factor n=1 Tax=Caminicella sporogenes DSM 14501 TaxID=1121266 RepID=A0A1M6QTK5_9FIRM|nr:transcription-repair coupling factor [Caminicella sporogenes]SHK23581.1 transcription-repair coupling factor [Caminicella sporogenes DSM 14501]